MYSAEERDRNIYDREELKTYNFTLKLSRLSTGDLDEI
jgi:hypothetical protein